jgi:hypothetical protein
VTIVGCDFHPSWQQVAIFDSSTGEIVEHKLGNGNGEAERFYRLLPVRSLIGVESCGNSQWFVELLEKLGHEVWIGDAAQIRASYVRKQKTDKRDAGHILKRGAPSSSLIGVPLEVESGMANLALVYGLRLLPEGELERVGSGSITLKNGREEHVTLHLLEGSKEEIEAQLKQSIEAFFDIYPEIQ